MYTNKTVLLITDKPESGKVWANILLQKSIQTTIMNPQETEILESAVSLVLIDIYDGSFYIINFITNLRAQLSSPLLLFAYDVDERRILAAYDSGIDDYIINPVSPQLFLAKVKSWLSRRETVAPINRAEIQTQAFTLCVEGQKLMSSEGAQIKLSNLEFRLLHLLMLHAGQVVNIDNIIQFVWGYTEERHMVKNLVYRLRRKIEPDPKNPQHIIYVADEGYLFRA